MLSTENFNNNKKKRDKFGETSPGSCKWQPVSQRSCLIGEDLRYVVSFPLEKVRDRIDERRKGFPYGE